MKRSIAAFLGALVLTSALPGAEAAAPITEVSSAATATAQAQSVFTDLDVVSIYNRSNALNLDTAARAMAAAGAARGTFAFGRGVSVGMDRVRRGGAIVQQAPAGFHYPMSTTVLPLAAVGPLMGRNIASMLANGFVVMGKSTADMRGAMVGDVIDLVGANEAIYSFAVGMVADDAVIGGAEILMSPAQADVIGAVVTSRIVLWGFTSRDAINAQLDANGLTSRADTRVRRSWDPPDPDSTLGLAETKQKLGEFAYRVNANGTDVTLSGDWVAAHLPPGREVLVPAIPINARCNNAIRADLQAALSEVASAGLGGAIDVGNANTYGGCYYPRFSRTSGALGFLSRHSWAQALDTNTTTNVQGTTPQMNCSVVRIFRKHNFAWGGNFITPDGMHFEWVGERRDQLLYPSRYCPNLPTTLSTEKVATPQTIDGVPASRATLFVEDGWGGE